MISLYLPKITKKEKKGNSELFLKNHIFYYFVLTILTEGFQFAGRMRAVCVISSQ